VLHADASSRIDSSLDWVRRVESKVSYHVMIGRNGAVYLVVPPDLNAWHAGVSSFLGQPNVNAFSVGVCLSNRNDGEEPYPDAQVRSAAEVCAALCRHYQIPLDHITTHALVATPTGRKTDPKGLSLDAFREQVRDLMKPKNAVTSTPTTLSAD
jgi:N-acetyl-anhydromuramyl-L-alanine amidase AmpD